jgi:hypothetical protein
MYVLYLRGDVLNTTFNNISVISDSQFYLWRKPEYPEKTTDLSQVTDKLYKYNINISHNKTMGLRNSFNNLEYNVTFLA